MTLLGPGVGQLDRQKSRLVSVRLTGTGDEHQCAADRAPAGLGAGTRDRAQDELTAIRPLMRARSWPGMGGAAPAHLHQGRPWTHP